MPAGVVTGDSDNIIIGGAQVLFDSNRVGFTDGDIEANCERTIKEFEDGQPLMIQLQVPIREKWNIKVPLVETTLENVARASSNLVVSSIAGSEVTVAVAQTFTFADWPGGPFQAFQVANAGVRAENLTTVVVTETDGSPTFVLNDDYYIDGSRGVIYRNPNGDIPEDASVKVTYHYTPVARKKIPFGKNSPILNKKVEFIHVSQVDGSVHHTCFWKCQGTGNLAFGHKKEEWGTLAAELVALPDPIAHPDEPTGFRIYVAPENAQAYLDTIVINP